MTLSDLASIGSLVSGVAVLVSLMYLAQQTRQTAINQRAAAHQGRSAFIADILLRISEPTLLRPYFLAQRGNPNLSEEEFAQYTNTFTALVMAWEDQFEQHKLGTLSDDRFDETIAAVKSTFQSPANRALWKSAFTKMVSKDFSTFVGALIVEARAIVPRDIFTDWKAELALEVNSTTPAKS